MDKDLTRKLQCIEKILCAIATNSTSNTGGGDASLVEQQLQTALLTALDTDLDLIRQYIGFENWDKIVGNSTEYTYVAGTAVPTDFLVDTIVYKTGLTTIFTRTFVYDANDNVTSITAS